MRAITVTPTSQTDTAGTISSANKNININSNNSNNRNSNNGLNRLLAAATKATFLNNPTFGCIIGNNNNNNMPTTSKYVFLQKNGNGQFTTFEGTPTVPTESSAAITTTDVAVSNNDASTSNNRNTNNVGNIVLLATEQFDIVDAQQQQHLITTTRNADDEELRPLAWLNDTNLIKSIATTTPISTTTITTTNGDANNMSIQSSNISSFKSIINNNSCIVNDIIEELPHHVVSEEQVIATTTKLIQNNHGNRHSTNNSSSNSNQQPQEFADIQITSLSVSDFQQQFIACNKRYTTTTATTIDKDHQINDQQQHFYGNIPALGGASTATTTVHVGPSGTTTVVEYKSNGNFIPTQNQLHNNSSNNNNNTTTTIMAANVNNNNTSSINFVPSTTSVTTTTATSTSTIKQLMLPNTIVTTANNMISNNSSNTIYQVHKQQINTNLASSSSGGSTTHHPHKKYLREKMNVLVDHGGGGGVVGTVASTITVVSSPASSNNSLSSIASNSTSSSTAAVNGGNSPVSKSSFYTLGGNGAANTSASGTVTAVAVNYSSSSSGVAALTNSISGSLVPLTATSIPAAFTIMHQNQHIVSTSPAISSPEPQTTKDYYTLSTPHQQQRHNIIRSPTSYSSYDNDSLKDFEILTNNSNMSAARLHTSTPQYQHQQHNHHQQMLQLQQEQLIPKSYNANAVNMTPQKQKHPNNVPYDPLVHTHNKPPYSFSSLIFMAIEGSNEKALPVKEIYSWIVQHFPYFKTAPTGWKNSVRHNLSLNKSFVKVEKAPHMGKGSLWRVEQQQRQNLIQALTRSPFFPNSAVDKISLKSPVGGGIVGNSGSSGIVNIISGMPTNNFDTMDGSSTGKSSNAVNVNGSGGNSKKTGFDPRLFPKLSKAFNEQNVLSDLPDDGLLPSEYSTPTTIQQHNHSNTKNNGKYNTYSSANTTTSLSSPLQNGGASNSIMGAFSNYASIERLARDCGADSIDDVNAAAAMLALKHGPKVFSETFQNGAPVITSSPSEDHTYSAGGAGNAGSGASTPHRNGSSSLTIGTSINGNGIVIINQQQQQHQNGVGGGCDQSNCASSDAAYESSEENHNITPEELEDQQRHRDGVDALLSLSLSSSVIDISAGSNTYSNSSNNCSPTKRPSSTSVEEEHISACLENNNYSNLNSNNNNVKMALLSSAAANVAVYTTASTTQQQRHHHQQLILDEGYSTQSYYGVAANAVGNIVGNIVGHHHQQQSHLHHLATSASVANTTKRSKPLRTLRTKFKRKTPWMR